jgi:uncharacterized membrane protein
MLVIDAIWIGGVMKGFYKANLGYIMADTIKWLPALIFYVLYIGALVYFVVIPGAQGGNISETIMRAAFFGLVAYATYDLTNHATLTGWPWIVTVIDMAWGSLLTGFLGGVGFYVSRFFS